MRSLRARLNNCDQLPFSTKCGTNVTSGPLNKETLAMRKRLLALFLKNPRYNAEAILKTRELFIYGEIQCTASSS
jgi:hypothetical protein